jgi:hypothetical protein
VRHGLRRPPAVGPLQYLDLRRLADCQGLEEALGFAAELRLILFEVSYQIRIIYVCLWRVGPPGKLGIGADDRRHPLERATAFHLPILEFVDVVDVAIGHRLVRQRPQTLGGLPLGRIRRQEMHMDPRGRLPLGTHMPAGTVEDQQDLLAVPRAHRVGELAERERERRQ